MRLYLALGVFIAFLAVGLLAYKYRGDAIGARAEAARIAGHLQTAVDVNRVQEATIGRMRAQAEADARGAAELAEQLAALNAAMQANNAALADLRKSDATVRDYLDTPVPDDLRRMYAR